MGGGEEECVSRAGEWAKRLEEFIANNVPALEDSEGERSAHITEYGDMEIDKRGDWNAESARKLARFIDENFGELPE